MRTPGERAKLLPDSNASGGAKDEPWIGMAEAAAHVGYVPTARRTQEATIRLFRKFLSRHRIKKHYRGRILLFRRSELDRAIERLTDVHEQEQQRDQFRGKFDHIERLAREHAQ